MSLEETIVDALELFPNIKDIFSMKKLMEIFEENEYSSLIYHLRKSIVDESRIQNALKKLEKEPNHIGVLAWLDFYLDSYYVIKHLDKYVSDLKGLDKFNAITGHLTHSFWQGYSEIEVAYYLKQLYGEIELEPLLPNGKSVDVAYTDGEKYYVEVIAPKRYYKNEQALQKSAEKSIVVELSDTTDRACEKIIKEINHFTGVLDDINSLLIINLKHTDFSEMEIEDCLLGISKLVIMKNVTTGEFIGTKVERENWTGFDYDDRLAKLGAIICYNKEKNLLGKSFFNKKIFQIMSEDSEIEPLLKLFDN